MSEVTVDPFDPATWPEYDETAHRAAVLAEADEMGEGGECRYEGSGFDWDALYLKIEERLRLVLPSSTDHPIFKAIQRTARKAYREAQ